MTVDGRASVAVLQEVAPTALTLREITARTARRMRQDVYYDDVDAVLRAAQREGQVTLEQEHKYDYTLNCWRAA